MAGEVSTSEVDGSVASMLIPSLRVDSRSSPLSKGVNI